MSNFNEYKMVTLSDVEERILKAISAYRNKLDKDGLSEEQEARILHTLDALNRLKENLMRWDE